MTKPQCPSVPPLPWSSGLTQPTDHDDLCRRWGAEFGPALDAAARAGVAAVVLFVREDGGGGVLTNRLAHNEAPLRLLDGVFHQFLDGDVVPVKKGGQA